jgi:single-strand DNA-binding protein
MDKASFEIVGNIGRIEFRDARNGRRLANLSVATSERWKRETGEVSEKTHWRRVTVFAPAKVDRIAELAKPGTRVRIVRQMRPTSWEDERGQTRYAIEFIVGPFGEIEFLAQTKAKPEGSSEPEQAREQPAEPAREKPTRRTVRGKMAAAGGH